MKRLAFLLSGGALCVCSPVTSMATAVVGDGPSIPSSLGQVELSSYSPQILTPAQTETLSSGGKTATVSLSNSSSPTLQGPFVSAYASAPTGANNPYSSLTYFFEVSGPNSVSVPLNAKGLIGAGQTSSGDFANSFFEVYSYPGFQKIATVAACGYSSNCTGYNPSPAAINEIFTPGTDGFYKNTAYGMDVANYSISFNANSNYLYEILIGSNVETFAGAGGTFVDPTLTISNAFALSNPGYKLDFSSGITNGAVSAAPEPSTWAMMLGGFAIVGVTLRRRQRPIARTACV